jgi:hypothetical protein
MDTMTRSDAAPHVKSAEQRDADVADLDLYRLASRLDRLAAVHGNADFRRAADIVASARSVVRKHMHPRDLEATHGS